MDLIIFHASCPDGWTAAYIAKMKYPEAEFKNPESLILTGQKTAIKMSLTRACNLIIPVQRTIRLRRN